MAWDYNQVLNEIKGLVPSNINAVPYGDPKVGSPSILFESNGVKYTTPLSTYKSLVKSYGNNAFRQLTTTPGLARLVSGGYADTSGFNQDTNQVNGKVKTINDFIGESVKNTPSTNGNFFTNTFLSSPLGVAGLLALPLGAAAATGAFSAPVAAAPAGAAAPVGSVTATPLASSGSGLTNALLNAPSGLGAEAGFTASKVAQDSILSSILAGAAKGGITSAATGGNPLEGGVLGAITGGAGNILSDALPFLSSTGDSMFSWKDLLSLGATVGGTYLSTEAAKDAANAQIYGAQSAADINQSATDRAIQLGYDALNRIDQRWQEALSISQPYRNAGDVALANYESLLYGTPLNQTSTYLSAKERGDDMTAYGDVTQPFQFETTPGYQFRFDEGMKALENSAAARGGVLSGANMKAINEYGQNFATTEFDNVLSRLSGLVSQGALSSGQATTGSQSVGAQESNVLSGIGNTITQGGDTAAQLATQIGAAQASGYLNQQNLPNTVANLGAQYIGKNWFGA